MVRRGEKWVTNVEKNLGQSIYLRVTNVIDCNLTLHRDILLGMWLTGDRVPRRPGFVSPASHRYDEWQNVAYQAKTKRSEASEFETPLPCLWHPNLDIIAPARSKLMIATAEPNFTTTTDSERERSEQRDSVQENGGGPAEKCLIKDEVEVVQPDNLLGVKTPSSSVQKVKFTLPPLESRICYHEGGDLAVEDLEKQGAILPEIISTADTVAIEGTQATIWSNYQLRIGKGNTLPPAARGTIWDIDMGGATRVAQQIKGLLLPKIIKHSTYSWASPVVTGQVVAGTV
ncbi:hypothetical protein PHMEG_00013740 [Phytophthora megakarya]|uniref:Eukaryotic/viral aspartic protease n=1 Tax=Phytophthora megakarya TaxID=4795 RepID=A0A225W602_9STRA|nr:hypothetical protein PHMEG_00013740 [Phytophthora megakarya]